ncbi:N-acetylmuramoyl-L-alanine amidase [Aquabacterium sp. A7-Y]|uniref:peptidoglycan recognition protein family protein n=1 Tax=Aquabacterium sp. A7-Y TaxID=1349605 RepID=UPI00223E8348|nr:peptidoglycan recognition family protein [Aquabacterium sp. A7-Y]MCW7538224.1 N-acetylmuramoyl-L-alanine amidase [Aquabacterium sp. A7-Y]
MLQINDKGQLQDPRVRPAISPAIERGRLERVQGIVVHQTGGPTAEATLRAYRRGGNGAHFLIEKDGTLYQTASVHKRTQHVGKLRARCLAENRCAPGEAEALREMTPTERNRHEMRKPVPERYPSNGDSVGIELVGQALPLDEPDPDRRTYERVTEAQNATLKWLVQGLLLHFGVPRSEVFRHPVVSQKNVTEAETAQW